MVHAADAVKSGHRRILIRTVDTDVVVLAVWMAQELHEAIDELWLAIGTGKSFRYIAAHKLAASLGPDKSKALPVFHAITGCDTVSSFAGRGKITNCMGSMGHFPRSDKCISDLGICTK